MIKNTQPNATMAFPTVYSSEITDLIKPLLDFYRTNGDPISTKQISKISRRFKNTSTENVDFSN